MGSAVSYAIDVHKVFVTAPDLFVHQRLVDFDSTFITQKSTLKNKKSFNP